MTKLVFPKLRLASLLREAGGLPVAEALAEANKNLARLGPEGRERARMVLQEIERVCLNLPARRDEAILIELYNLASREIGAASVGGLEGFDAALLSLCNLLDHMKSHGRWDREAILVHVKSLHLLLSVHGPMGDEAEAILSGLRKVTDRYAPPELHA